MAETENIPPPLDYVLDELAFWNRSNYQAGIYVQIIGKNVTDEMDHQAGIPHKYTVQDIESQKIYDGIAGVELLKCITEEWPQDADFDPTPQPFPSPKQRSKPRIFKKKTEKEMEEILGNRTSESTNMQTKWASKSLRYLLDVYIT